MTGLLDDGPARVTAPPAAPVAGQGPAARPAAAASPPAAAVAAGWVGTRVALLVFVWLACAVTGVQTDLLRTRPGEWLLARQVWSDSGHFLRIARQGYPRGDDCCDQAFFPAYPALVRLVSPVTAGSLAAAGILVSLAAGAVAAVLLARLAALTAGTAQGRAQGPAQARDAVTYLAVAPYGVFFTAVYSESLFLALALGAWLAGLRRRWWWAGLLAGLATATRLNGVFLAAGLAVMYLVQLRSDGRLRPRADVLALLGPAVALGGFVAVLRARHGSWTAWSDAETRGWDRHVSWPWSAAAHAWRSLLEGGAPHVTLAHGMDLVALLIGPALVVALAVRRQWPELVYVGLSVAVLSCSTTSLSTARYSLTWFPGYLLLAAVTARPGRRWLRNAVVLASLPALAAVSLVFGSHGWVG